VCSPRGATGLQLIPNKKLQQQQQQNTQIFLRQGDIKGFMQFTLHQKSAIEIAW
jgi:hypothetical protein